MERLNDKHSLNLALNQMKVKNTDMSTNTKYSSKLLKSIDVSIKNIKAENIQYIYFMFFHFNFQRFYSKVNLI